MRRDLAQRQCGSCRAPVLWARTLAGKPMPVDAGPDPRGRATLWWDDLDEPRVLVGRDNPPSPAGWERMDSQTYTSHFATCPNAERHRRQRG